MQQVSDSINSAAPGDQTMRYIAQQISSENSTHQLIHSSKGGKQHPCVYWLKTEMFIYTEPFTNMHTTQAIPSVNKLWTLI